MEKGWIKLWRQLKENPLMRRPAYRSVWIEILLEASHSEGSRVSFNGEIIVLKPGQFTTGAYKISSGTGVARGTVEDILRAFKSQEMIQVRTDRQCSLITVKNWEKYQNIQEPIQERSRNDPGTIQERSVENPGLRKNVRKNGRMEEGNNLPPAAENLPAKVVSEYYRLKGWSKENAPPRAFASHLRPAKQLLEITGGYDGAVKKLSEVKSWADARDLEWSIETIFKKWDELDKPVLEKNKKPYIEGDRAYEKNGDWFIINSSGEHKKYIGPLDKLVFK